MSLYTQGARLMHKPVALAKIGDPGWAFDFTGTWGRQKIRAEKVHGVYPGVTMPNNAMATVPIMTLQQCEALLEYWMSVGSDMMVQAVKEVAGKLSDAARYSLEILKPAHEAYLAEVKAWHVKWENAAVANDAQRSAEAWVLTKKYSIALSGAVWSGYNVKRGLSLAIESVHEVVKDYKDDFLDLWGKIWPYLKWILIGVSGIFVFMVLRWIFGSR